MYLTNKCGIRSNCCQRNPIISAPQSGFIDVLNSGGYLIRMSGSYVNNGMTYRYSIAPFPVAQRGHVIIPPNSTNITLNVEFLSILFTWINLISASFTHTDVYCFETYGTVFAPSYGRVPCESPN